MYVIVVIDGQPINAPFDSAVAGLTFGIYFGALAEIGASQFGWMVAAFL